MNLPHGRPKANCVKVDPISMKYIKKNPRTTMT